MTSAMPPTQPLVWPAPHGAASGIATGALGILRGTPGGDLSTYSSTVPAVPTASTSTSRRRRQGLAGKSSGSRTGRDYRTAARRLSLSGKAPLKIPVGLVGLAELARRTGQTAAVHPHQ